MTLRLSDSQLTILSAACGREDGSVFPITAKLTGGALQKVLTSLLGKGLLEEIQATDPETVWRAPEDGGSFTLRAAPAAYAGARHRPGRGSSRRAPRPAALPTPGRLKPASLHHRSRSAGAGA